MEKLTLYQFETCPFCAKVREKLDELGFEYEPVNVSRDREDETRKLLNEKTGKWPVPVLKIGDEEYIAESNDIIARLEGMKG